MSILSDSHGITPLTNMSNNRLYCRQCACSGKPIRKHVHIIGVACECVLISLVFAEERCACTPSLVRSTPIQCLIYPQAQVHPKYGVSLSKSNLLIKTP